MSARGLHVCPICGREAAPRNGNPKNPAFPFCSPACKVVDLGRWFDGSYRIPAPLEQDQSSPPQADAADGGLDAPSAASPSHPSHEEDE